MAKDRISNRLEVGDKVVVALPEAQIFGFVSQIDEPPLITGVRKTGTEKRPGRVLVSCVIALPVEADLGDAVMQLVKVYDANKQDHHKESTEERPN